VKITDNDSVGIEDITITSVVPMANPVPTANLPLDCPPTPLPLTQAGRPMRNYCRPQRFDDTPPEPPTNIDISPNIPNVMRHVILHVRWRRAVSRIVRGNTLKHGQSSLYRGIAMTRLSTLCKCQPGDHVTTHDLHSTVTSMQCTVTCTPPQNSNALIANGL
jgi:hypothetical protein